jgi:exodeoxyribonuclease VII small subunit
MTKPEKAIEEYTFEEALEALETIVNQLEEGDHALETALGLFERGQLLAQRCNKQLDEASLRVQQLTVDGEIVER